LRDAVGALIAPAPYRPLSPEWRNKIEPDMPLRVGLKINMSLFDPSRAQRDKSLASTATSSGFLPIALWSVMP
jgi:hypothetical protein